METKKGPIDIKIDLTDEVLSVIKELKKLPGTEERISSNYNKRKNAIFYKAKSIEDLKCKCCQEKAVYIHYRSHFLHKIMLKIREDKFLTVDHIKSKANGGKDSFNNYQILCNFCNGRKGSMKVSNIFLLRMIFKFDLDKKYNKLKRLKNKLIFKIMEKNLWQLFFV